ncbi:hypothetical protein HTZ97_05605 [Desulfuromonas acetoxidans]|uniref:Uncharacterized protein n=1 Tax=Desulfuromonas acetoxidans (strain DSM 684 / 11070) TaxID=281689 RepID=Q1K2Z0_DESA6|nr:hypothetical protein [Desulfuromonas acetoxidans]EAT16741.1 hypothetical protein Dace_1993 [Desulfuromonas acetoxidans DSM 684]NVD23681.1 hypothetical protein [Desulfuromonas acetoxidans]NVE15934.1 hypothetical protein [Desulfuromonas acetoxidans]
MSSKDNLPSGAGVTGAGLTAAGVIAGAGIIKITVFLGMALLRTWKGRSFLLLIAFAYMGFIYSSYEDSMAPKREKYAKEVAAVKKLAQERALPQELDSFLEKYRNYPLVAVARPNYNIDIPDVLSDKYGKKVYLDVPLTIELYDRMLIPQNKTKTKGTITYMGEPDKVVGITLVSKNWDSYFTTVIPEKKIPFGLYRITAEGAIKKNGKYIKVETVAWVNITSNVGYTVKLDSERAPKVWIKKELPPPPKENPIMKPFVRMVSGAKSLFGI